MDQKAPLEIDLQLLKNKNLVRNNEYRFINSELGFVSSLTKVQSDFLRFGQPYRIQEGRITFVTKGSAVVQHLIAALLYNIEYITKSNQQEANNHLTHQEDIFQRFISLVNAHSKTQRNVTFYADKLCLTPRYLNTVIRQTSQQTVMDWINQSIILEAKVQLKHTNRLVYQISDELNFPNPSFFCKFFKRMTGMTPQEYQKSK